MCVGLDFGLVEVGMASVFVPCLVQVPQMGGSHTVEPKPTSEQVAMDPPGGEKVPKRNKCGSEKEIEEKGSEEEGSGGLGHGLADPKQLGGRSRGDSEGR